MFRGLSLGPGDEGRRQIWTQDLWVGLADARAMKGRVVRLDLGEE